MHNDFLILADIKRNEHLMKTEELFVTQKSEWFIDFANHFRTICEHIQKLQKDSILPTISYLDYTMLYTNFINRQYTADVIVYGDKNYLDKNQHLIGSYDISYLFTYFDKLWDDLINLKRHYIKQATAKEVTAFMLEEVSSFYSYLATIARSAIKKCFDKSHFTCIDLNEEFTVNVGDYMAKTETVYMEKKNKNANRLAEWFEQRLIGKYIFGDYSGLDFSDRAFMNTDFRYAIFQGSTLKNTNFEGSSLIGVNFRNANIEGCCFNNCSIHEADFYCAKLNGASFINARARVGCADEKEWRYVGFLPIIFCYADLTNTNFTDTNLSGADFTGADLTGADFTGADLTGANFKDAVLTGTIFADAILDGSFRRDMPM